MATVRVRKYVRLPGKSGEIALGTVHKDVRLLGEK